MIFSQYTRMLQIMRDDFEQKGIRFSYLDGSSKNRLEIVKQFNEDESIPLPSVHAFAQAHPEVEVQIYEAHHGFNCDQRSAWNPIAAQLARERTLAFLARHLA